jgi:transporter family-2 protein
MNFYYTIPIILGLSIVTQGAMNQVIGTERGLGFAVMLNASVFFVLSILLYFFLTRFSTSFSASLANILPVKETTESLKWYYIIPGICGFLIVLGSPLAMGQIGGAAFFVLLILAQILTSLLYDSFIVGSPLNFSKILGALLTFAGAALFISSKK